MKIYLADIDRFTLRGKQSQISEVKTCKIRRKLKPAPESKKGAVQQRLFSRSISERPDGRR